LRILTFKFSDAILAKTGLDQPALVTASCARRWTAAHMHVILFLNLEQLLSHWQ
jgi:hypothetical protein